mmetsp:Transcript_2357/g.6803  ORF Transcript_2357/g.6803 Transcript_2357/m.6803 type:complete len:203 (-) Transcript_2357:248-856(-)
MRRSMSVLFISVQSSSVKTCSCTYRLVSNLSNVSERFETLTWPGPHFGTDSNTMKGSRTLPPTQAQAAEMVAFGAKRRSSKRSTRRGMSVMRYSPFQRAHKSKRFSNSVSCKEPEVSDKGEGQWKGFEEDNFTGKYCMRQVDPNHCTGSFTMTRGSTDFSLDPLRKACLPQGTCHMPGASQFFCIIKYIALVPELGKPATPQ